MITRQRITETPHYTAWVARLRSALAIRGQRTALATHLANSRSQDINSWRVTLSRITHQGQMINAEDLLTITAWMEKRADA